MLSFLTAMSLAVLGGATLTPIQKTPSISYTQASCTTNKSIIAAPKTQVKKVKATVKAQKPILAPGEIETLINKYAADYGVDPNLMKRIGKCESRFNPNAVNGQHKGIYQFATKTWISTRKSMGLDTNPDLRFSAEESIKTAAFKLGHGGIMAWKECL